MPIMPPNGITSLREDVLKLVQPYHKSTHGTPFSADQLIVMAIVAIGTHSVSRQEIFYWFLDHSHTLRDRWRWRNFKVLALTFEDLIPDFGLAFSLYSVPLVDRDSDAPAVAGNHTNYTVDEQRARLYLEPCLAPRKGIFRFEVLPPELRLVIHEYALAYPPIATGAQTREASYPWLFTDRREFGNAFPDATFDQCLPIRRATDTIGLLRVGSKEARRGASHVSYSINSFHLHTHDALDKFIASAPSARLNSLREISFFYDCPPDQQVRVYEIAFSRVLGEGKLKSITIFADDDSWFSAEEDTPGPVVRTVRRYEDVTQFPGIRTLVQLLAKTIRWRVEGDAELMGAYVTEEVAKVHAQMYPGASDGK